MSEDTEKHGSGADQGGEGNEGEGPAQGDPAADDAPTPTHPAEDGPAEDSDVEDVERGHADDVGTPAEEVQRAERREREAGEG